MQNLNEKSEEMAQREIESILEDLRLQNLFYFLWNLDKKLERNVRYE